MTIADVVVLLATALVFLAARHAALLIRVQHVLDACSRAQDHALAAQKNAADVLSRQTALSAETEARDRAQIAVWVEQAKFAGYAAAMRDVDLRPAHRVLVVDRETGRVVRATAPVPYSRAMILAGMALNDGGDGVVVEVVREERE